MCQLFAYFDKSVHYFVKLLYFELLRIIVLSFLVRCMVYFVLLPRLIMNKDLYNSEYVKRISLYKSTITLLTLLYSDIARPTSRQI